MRGFVLACLVACGGAPHEPAAPVTEPAPAPAPAPAINHLNDPDLNPPPPRKLLSIDWASVHLASDADALALWQQIAPTGEDWEAKLDEIPGRSPVRRQLAIALLHEGNFTCTPPPAAPCAQAPVDVPAPADAATLADPCLRRLLAMWAVDELDVTDLPAVHDALRAIAAIPPPESQLVAAAIRAIPEDDQDDRYELLALAWKAGQHELVDGLLSTLDDAHVLEAATQLHVDGAYDRLAAADHRDAFLAAVTDEQLAPAARSSAMDELAAPQDALAPDLRAALVKAGKSPDCSVAAAAARTLDLHGDHALVPKLPRTRSPKVMMRSLCVLASFEQLQRTDEASYLPGYIPSKGLELATVTYDPYSDSDPDGDGDVHTEHQVTLIPQDQVVLPEIDDLVRAMTHCTGQVCTSDERAFRFTFQPWAGGLLLSRIEVTELPPCGTSSAVSRP